jgi:cell division protein FtsB
VRQSLFRLAFLLCCIGAASWLAWTAEHGERGRERLVERQAQFKRLVEILDDEARKRDSLARRVNLMRSGKLDPDMLDERSRKMLEFSHPDDVVVLLKY